MSDIKDGGPAFPMVAQNWNRTGMTLRDYIAAKVLPALVERYECELPDELAREAYDLADAMLAARKP